MLFLVASGVCIRMLSAKRRLEIRTLFYIVPSGNACSCFYVHMIRCQWKPALSPSLSMINLYSSGMEWQFPFLFPSYTIRTCCSNFDVRHNHRSCIRKADATTVSPICIGIESLSWIRNSTLCFGACSSPVFVSDVAGLHNSRQKLAYHSSDWNLFVQVIVVIVVFDSINSFLKIKESLLKVCWQVLIALWGGPNIQGMQLDCQCVQWPDCFLSVFFILYFLVLIHLKLTLEPVSYWNN